MKKTTRGVLLATLLMLLATLLSAPAAQAVELRQAKTPDYNVGYLGDEDAWYQFWYLRKQADGTGTVLEQYYTRCGDASQYNDTPARIDEVKVWSKKTNALLFQWGQAGGDTWPVNDTGVYCGENFVQGNDAEPEQIAFAGQCLIVRMTILDINVKDYAPDPYYASWHTEVCL